MSILFLALTTLLAGGGCFWVLGRRRPRPAGTWAMSALLGFFALFLASYAPLVESAVEKAMPNGTQILSDSASLGATAAVLAVSLQLNLGPAGAKELIRSRRKWAIASLVGIVALVVYTQATHRSTNAHALYTLLYISIIGATDANFVVQALRQAKKAHRATVRFGLRTAAAGSTFALIHLGYRTIQLVAPGQRPENNRNDDGHTSLSATHYAFGVASPALAVVLICLGLTLPAVLYPIRHVRRHRWEKESFEALAPLWNDLAEAMPYIVLSLSRPLTYSAPDSDTAFHLQRRVVEISDGILALRPYRSLEAQEMARTAFDARTERGAAAIEAAVLTAALANLVAGQPATHIAPPAAQTASRKDLDADTQWLVHVAHAYANQDQHVAGAGRSALARTVSR